MRPLPKVKLNSRVLGASRDDIENIENMADRPPMFKKRGRVKENCDEESTTSEEL
jgi:hypothetical protein